MARGDLLHVGTPLGGCVWMRLSEVSDFLTNNPNWIPVAGQKVNRPSSPYHDMTLPDSGDAFLSWKADSVADGTIKNVNNPEPLSLKLTENHLPPMSNLLKPEILYKITSFELGDGGGSGVLVSTEMFGTNILYRDGTWSFDTLNDDSSTDRNYIVCSQEAWENMIFWDPSHSHSISMTHNSSGHNDGWVKHGNGFNYPSITVQYKMKTTQPTQTNVSFERTVACMIGVLLMRIE